MEHGTMALTVNTNTAAINALTNFQHTNRALSNSFQKISSGLRITKAADDAAGLAVAENLDAQSQSLRQARRNTNDGISVIQTAEGSTNEVANILKRMRELIVEASSETLNSTERAYVKTEVQALEAEINRIGQVTEFNGIKLGVQSAAAANAPPGAIDVQVGVHNTSNDRITVSLMHVQTSTGLSLASFDLATSNGTVWGATLSKVDSALDRVNTYRAKFGATQNRLSSALNNLEVYTENMQAAESQIRDADFAHETAEMAKYQIMAQAGTAVLAQANQINQGAVRLLG
jgi:flagellin